MENLIQVLKKLTARRLQNNSASRAKQLLFKKSDYPFKQFIAEKNAEYPGNACHG
jgi:hypothetical protein